MSDEGPRHPLSSPPARRTVAIVCLVVLVVAGGAVHFLLADAAATDIAGDALYAAAAYLAVVILGPRLRPIAAGAIAAAWCVAIELFQLTGIPLAVGEAFPPALLVLGAGFDPRDLLVYLAAIGACTLVDAASSSAVRRRRQAETPG